jgi:hypothetical protein
MLRLYSVEVYIYEGHVGGECVTVQAVAVLLLIDALLGV